jgi:YVTN family beta-propeller protein
MNKSSTYFILFIAILNSFISCKKDEPPIKPSANITSGGSGFVYVLNEGNFMASNGSITRLNLSDGSIVSDFYSIQNNGFQIGDVPQSMAIHNGKFYVVVNNSSKIEILDRYTFQKIGQITGLTSPRYFLPISNNKAYVTDLFSNTISLVDLNSNLVVSTIALNGWSEEMHQVYGKVFVTSKNTNKLYVINAQNDQLQDSITIGFGGSGIVEDKFGKIWVLCSGDQTSQIAKLVRIDPLNLSIDTSFVFSSISNNPFRLSINGNKDELFFLDNAGVFKMNVSGSFSSSPIIPKGNKNFYSIGIDPQNGNIYVSDAIDFNQNGIIYRYNNSGNPIDQFSCGIIPGFIFFDK